MPDHDPTALPVKRMNYYQYQFLNVADFTAEQDYHRAMRYRHNRSLHSRGIGDGLDVTPKSNQLAVEISPGLAIDGEGREMVVLPPGKDVTLTGLTGDVNIVIEYQAEEDDPVTSTGTPGNTRINEDPHAFGTQQAPTGDQILLAKVSIAGGVVANVDTSVRQYSSAVARDDQVLSAQIKEADGASAQNTEIGSGIKTGHIQDGAVTTPKLADDAVSSGKIAPADGTTAQDVNNGSGVKTGHIQDGAVTGAKVQDGSLTGAELADNSVSGIKLIDNSVAGSRLTDNSVPGQKLTDASVNGGKLTDNTVQGTKIVDSSLAGTKLQNLTVTGPKVADNAIPGTKLQDATTPGAKLQDNSVAGAKLADNSVPGAKLTDLSVGGGKFTDNSVPGAKLVDNTVSGTKLIDNNVNALKLLDGSIPSQKLADRSVTQLKHGQNSVSLAELKSQGSSPWKFTLQLTASTVTGLASTPAGYGILGIGLPAPKTAGYPDPPTQTLASGWIDHAIYVLSVVAVTPDPGVTMSFMRLTFDVVQTNYFPGAAGAQASMGRQVTLNAYAPGLAVPAGTTPNITFWLQYQAILPT